MTGSFRRGLLIAVIAFVAGVSGAVLGRVLLDPAPAKSVELHEFLHDRLDLDASQQAGLSMLEARFALRKRALEVQLRSDNVRLAEAIASEHGNGPLVNAAVDHAHATMGRLQKETLAHIFAMRALMRPDQARKFDAAVTRALTDEGP